MTMPDLPVNKYRAAIEVLQQGRDVLVDGLADEILDQDAGLMEGGYLFNEFLETQGTRLHFLSLLVSQLEQSAEAFDEAHSAPPKAAPKRRSRSKKLTQHPSNKGPADKGPADDA
jgi:hypothetical protein